MKTRKINIADSHYKNNEGTQNQDTRNKKKFIFVSFNRFKEFPLFY